MTGHNALLLIHKRPGITSFSSLSPIKQYINKKAGHAGTLDRFAEGLLIVLTGSFTHLNQLFSALDKQYEATVHFGIQTTTLDPEGDVQYTGPLPTRESVEQVIKEQYIGKILQEPPRFSALHVFGRRSYQIAREGKEVSLEKRAVEVYDIKIRAWEPPYMQMAVHCSKGTYIRSLARDIGIACGSYAYLSALQRTAIGPYTLSDAQYPEDIASLTGQFASQREFLFRLDGIRCVQVTPDAIKQLKQGRPIPASQVLDSDGKRGCDYAMVFDVHGALVAIAAMRDDSLSARGISWIECEEG